MSETRFTKFSAFSVDPRVGISWSTLETDDRFYLSNILLEIRHFKKNNYSNVV